MILLINILLLLNMETSLIKKGREREKEENVYSAWGVNHSSLPVFSWKGPLATSNYLSARTSKGLVPRDQLRTIQAESIAARNPRAIPVPIGQKGYEGDRKQRIKINYLSVEGN